MILYHDQPVPVFSIPPNWKASVVVTEDWNVFARESLDTSETRRGSMPRPLYRIEYSTMTLSAQEQGYIRKVLEAAGDLPIAVPFWEDAVEVTIAGTAGNPWIDVEDTSDTLLDVLPFVLIWSAFNVWEGHRIAAVNSSQVQVVDALQADWPAGSKVVPVAVGRLSKQKTTALTDTADVFRVRFEELWLNEGPMLCHVIEGTAAGASKPFEVECVGGALL